VVVSSQNTSDITDIKKPLSDLHAEALQPKGAVLAITLALTAPKFNHGIVVTCLPLILKNQLASESESRHPGDAQEFILDIP